jgi:peptide/nickel transport system ATP-binding protein
MRVRDIVGEGLLFRKSLPVAERERRVRETLLKVALPEHLHDRYPHELSGGQRQRVNIARAIVVEPRFVVADEPVSALDLTVQRQIMELLLELRASLGFGCLFVSHDLVAVGRLADRIGVLYRGQLVELGTRDEVFECPRHPYTRELLGSLIDPVERPLAAEARA